MKLASLFRRRGSGRIRRRAGTRPSTRLAVESLEDRAVPSGLGVDVVPADPNDWPMFNHDPSGSRYNQAEHILSPATIGDLEIKWSFPTAGPIAG
ncbi:MAG: hypothetical protein L0Y72_14835, partial [Gemmataceae bacterium]|nr:hypothetical protein [Gemmataceae bacterium]